jgi:hypothetical protein
MSSSWGPKLEKKLNALADGASKESMQTLATWVGFNRKHAAVFAKTFLQALLSATNTDTTRQWLYWQVLSEVLLAHHADNPDKWEKASDLRTSLGEEAVIPALEGLLLGGAASRQSVTVMTDKMEGLCKQWDKHNVFGSPTLIGQIRRLLASTAAEAPVEATSPLAKSETTPPPAAAAAVEVTASEAASPTEKKKKDDMQLAVDNAGGNNKTETTPESSSNRRNSLSSVGSSGGNNKHHRRGSSVAAGAEIVDYDFDSKVS